MNPTPIAKSGLLALSLVASLLVVACAATPMAPTTTALTAQLAGATEVPPTKSTATGTVSATLNPASNLLSWTVTYSGLTGPATAGHFHGPAPAGQNAGVVVPLSAPLASPISGSTTLTPAQAADLLAGKWYLNLHTAANPGGEIRGQVSVRP